MSPGKRKSVVATKDGLDVRWEVLTQTLPQALAYSVSPFPLGRELIMLGILWLVLLRPGVRWTVRLLALMLMLEGLLFLRAGGVNGRAPVVWAQWWGVGHFVFGMALIFVAGWRAANFSSRGLSHAESVP